MSLQEPLSSLDLTDSKVHWDYSLKRFNTLRIGGTAAAFIEVGNPPELSQILQCLHTSQTPWFILGKGSNLLIQDQGWDGVVLRLGGAFKQWEPQPEHHQIMVGAALADVTVAQRCGCLGWSGLEFLIGIPGTVGGAVAMNAGAHGQDTASCLKHVWWLDQQGTFHDAPASELHFDYRTSSFHQLSGQIVTQVLFELKPSNCKDVRTRIDEMKAFRMQKQPWGQPNCGSVFKNPPDHAAAQLIEAAGLKGLSQGDAQVSERHSNFIVNLGKASSADVLTLIQKLQTQVEQQFNITLTPEVQVFPPLK